MDNIFKVFDKNKKLERENFRLRGELEYAVSMLQSIESLGQFEPHSAKLANIAIETLKYDHKNLIGGGIIPMHKDRIIGL